MGWNCGRKEREVERRDRTEEIHPCRLLNIVIQSSSSRVLLTHIQTHLRETFQSESSLDSCPLIDGLIYCQSRLGDFLSRSKHETQWCVYIDFKSIVKVNSVQNLSLVNLFNKHEFRLKKLTLVSLNMEIKFGSWINFLFHWMSLISIKFFPR